MDFKVKAFKAGMRVYLNQFLAVIITVILIVPLLSMAQKLPWLFSGITTWIFVAMVYSTMWRVGARDARRIPGFFPTRKHRLSFRFIVTVLPVCLLILRLAAPGIWRVDLPFMKGEVDFFIGGLKIEGTTDFILRLWYLPLAAFVPTGSIFAYAAQMIVVPAVVFEGYFVGL